MFVFAHSCLSESATEKLVRQHEAEALSSDEFVNAIGEHSFHAINAICDDISDATFYRSTTDGSIYFSKNDVDMVFTRPTLH